MTSRRHGYENPTFGGRERTLSTNSIDPNEDPVTGLERVASYSGLGTPSRRRMEEEDQHLDSSTSEEMKEHEMLISSNFESLNYEICENQLYKDQELQPEHSVRLWNDSRNRWVACFFIGVGTAVIAAGIDILVTYSKQIKFDVIIRPLISKCDNDLELAGTSCFWRVEAAWILYNCILVAIAGSLVIFWSPIAGGSGIPQIKCFLNGIHIPDVVRLKTLFAKAVGVACAVGGGLAAGKEGPMIHSGAVVGAGVSSGRCQSLKLDSGLFKSFRNDREQRDFVSAGAAAGVAAAFGAPIGGVLFALEEGSSFWNQNLTWRMFFTAMVSSFTVSSILSWFNGRSGWLSWNGLANFGVFENKSYNIWEIPFFLLQGVIGGLTGALFNHMNARLTVFRRKYVSNKFQRLLECLLVAAVSAFAGFITMFLVDDCQPVGSSPNITDVNQMWCKKGEYSAVANLFFQNPEESVKSLFHNPANSFRPWTLLIFSIEYYLLTLWTFGLAVPSGIFIPALLTGAAWGRLYGIAIEKLFPNITGIDPGKYALAGAAAQLGGLVRMTISLTAIIMEATKDITFGLPIMLVLMLTKWVGDFFSDGLYDLHIELAEVPLLGWHPPKMCRNILAKSVMRSDVVALELRERVGRLLTVLRQTPHHGFPVVDRIEEGLSSELPDYGRLQGLLLRSHLIAILRKRAFYEDGGRMPVVDISEADYDSSDVASLELTSADEACWVDLGPFMHPHPHRVPLNASLPFIFRLFRGLGLRYIAVVNNDNRLRGMITRKDVARFKEEKTRDRYRVHELGITGDTSH